MRRIRALLIALAAAQLAAVPVHGQSATVDKARAARLAGRLDTAEQLLKGAMRSEPNQVQLFYNMGLVYEARAQAAPAGKTRQAHYRTAAGWLERAFGALGKARASADAFRIQAALGTVYLGLEDFPRARLNLLRALSGEKLLSRSERGQLLASLGYLYALQGDTKGARGYFERAAALGNGFARENLRRLNAAGLR